MLLGVAGEGDALQPGGAGIDEDEEVAIADIRPRRRDVGDDRILVELLGGDDPHRDAVAAEHRQERVVPSLQPAFAEGDLLRPRQQRRRTGIGLLRRGRRRYGDRCSAREQERDQTGTHRPMVAAVM